jgi:putative DNA primase/helicase
MQGVLDLLRQSSSEGGAEIIKGSQSQTGAKRYRIRSCFCLSSINAGIEHQADESRISVLSLKDRDPATQGADAQARFDELNRNVQSLITPDYAAGMLARSVRLLPVIRLNAETFARAVSVVFGSRRTGDQLGALLAGAFALHSDRPIAAEAAESWVRKQEWGNAVGGEVERDELRLLSHITQYRVRFSPGNGAPVEATIGRLMMAAAKNDSQINPDIADLELRQTGIRFDARAGKYGVYVSTNPPPESHNGWHPMVGRMVPSARSPPWGHRRRTKDDPVRFRPHGQSLLGADERDRYAGGGVTM